MNPLKAFIAGLAFPAAAVPILYSIFYFADLGEIRNIPFQFFPLYLPIIFGLWNMIDHLIGKRCPIKNRNLHLWFNGILLGFILALVGVFIVHLPTLLFGLTGGWEYSPLIIIPILYGLIWRYIIKFLNDLLGV